jgi:pantothenate kinase
LTSAPANTESASVQKGLSEIKGRLHTEGIQVVQELARELREEQAGSGVRRIIGIVGLPGTGKSTFAEALAKELGASDCVVVPMDGFHLGNAIIQGTELASRKGAIDTFDADGYIALLRRLKDRTENVTYAPAYRRGMEEPIASSIAIPASVPFVLTEGNYLLADVEPWNRVREYLHEAWFIDTPRELRIPRLIKRHIAFGKSLAEATTWVLGPDETNARLIETTKGLADRIIRWA